MTEQVPGCPACGRRIMQSISNRCMYCGATLPEEHHLDDVGKNRLLTEKLEQFRQNEENAESIISGMRRDFALPEKKSRKARRQESKDASAAAAAAIAASITTTNNGGGCGK